MSHYGLSLEDIGGQGEFVREGNLNRFYENTPTVKSMSPGTFVCPPAHPIDVALPNRLYHPIK